jgi:hypothetical protein
MPSDISAERQKQIIDKVARFIVSRQFTAPAILFLEGFKPLAWLGSRYATIFLEPFIPFYERESRELIEALGETESVEMLIKRIEELELESQKEAKPKARASWLSEIRKRMKLSW